MGLRRGSFASRTARREKRERQWRSAMTSREEAPQLRRKKLAQRVEKSVEISLELGLRMSYFSLH
jgi:hypothetical protein